MKEHGFNKVLVARHSPKNGCFAADGEVLTVVPREVVPKEFHVEHYIVSVADMKTRSKYGWVKEVEPFTLTSFLAKYLSCPPSDRELEHVRTMLTSISRLPEGTPVYGSYVLRGVLQKSMIFTVHKVFLYDA